MSRFLRFNGPTKTKPVPSPEFIGILVLGGKFCGIQNFGFGHVGAAAKAVVVERIERFWLESTNREAVSWPEGTVNERVDWRLREMTEIVRSFQKGADQEGD